MKKLLTIIFILLCCCQLAGLDPEKAVDQYLLDQWEVTEGIPSNTIHSIAQTPDGYLWIATSKGLARFDGIKFSIIPFAENKTGNPTEVIIPDTLFVDREGTLWIGSSEGLSSYYHQTGALKIFTPADGITRDRIRRIADDMKGNLWISFYSSYVNRFANGKFTAFNESRGLTGKKINAIIEDRNGNLLFGSRENGMFIYKEGKFFPYPVPALESVNIITMYEDQEGELWIGTNNGLFRVTDRGTQKYYTQDGLSNNHITYLTEDSDRSLWIGTIKGLNRIKKKQDGSINIEMMLSQFTITCLFEDTENSLWIGTYDSGMRRLKEGKFISYEPLQAHQEEFLLSVFEDHKGDFWIGTLSGKIFHCRGTDLIESVESLASTGTGILCIAEDAKGNIWVGTSGEGVFQKTNGKFTQFTTREGLADDVVSSIFRDHHGNLWLSTFDGVSVIRHNNGVIESFNARDGLLGNRVHNVYEDKNQNIWIAADKGITVLKDGKATKENITYYLQDISVTCIYEDNPEPGTGDKAQRISWIATHGAGLKRLDLADGSVVSYTTAEGMATDFLYQFFADQQENFWLMSNSGILRVNKRELNHYVKGSGDMINCTSFGISDGMKSLEFNSEFSRHSAIKTRNGEFWFITKKGISIVNPVKVPVNKIPPPVVIEEIFFNERPVPLHQEGAYTFKGRKDIRFHFTAPTFLSPEKIKFKYLLEGFDEQWVFLTPGSERTAVYKSLAPGTYTFRVTACNAEGVWNRNGDALAFTLEPLFYETLIFKIAALILLAGLVAGGWYIYKKRPFTKKEKYKDSSLAPQFVQECIKKLRRIMETDKVYRDADLSLPLLAEKLSITPHVLSQVLNEQLNQNFADFVNSYRIEEAKKILGGPRGSQKKIATVAFDVGFNTIVAFYNAFKKYTDMTPAQYKKEAGKKK